MRSGGYFKLPAGAWTDDTAMALCLADSLLLDPNLNPKDLLDRFCDWAANGINTSTGQCVGIGQNTLRVLGNYHRNGSLQAPETRQKSDGNGAIMRLAPVAIRHWSNRKEAMRWASLQSQTTHFSELSAASCEYLASALISLISGEDWEQANKAEGFRVWPQAVASFAQTDWKTRSRQSIRSTGYVIDTMEAALWSVDTTSSFSEALLLAVNLGDDADSVGAVTGQLAGARYGLSAMPKGWLEVLTKREHIETIARQLYARSIAGVA
jgi:ADP-ribosyl-[dinitrogen reductase] hydrolase